MSEKKRGLGRGLGALIPTSDQSGSSVVADVVLTPGGGVRTSTADPGLRIEQSTDGAVAHYREIPLDQIRPNPRQPREVFEEQALAELVHSLREVGLLQPVLVRPVDDGYELVAGERRWRAAQAAGFTSIPAIVRQTDDDVLLRDALLENLHRIQLNPLEEAAAYQQLLTDFSCTQDQLAERIGRSRPQVTNTLRLLKLPPSVQRRVAAGVLSAGHARALLSLDDPADQERLAQRIVAEGLSVRGAEEIVTLGLEPEKKRQKRTKRSNDPVLDDLAAALSDRWDTQVRVELGQSKGRMTIAFASREDLSRIVAEMAPDAVGIVESDPR